jgi:hypothetical protein
MIRERGAWELGAGAESRPVRFEGGRVVCSCSGDCNAGAARYGKPKSRTQASGTRVVASLPVASLHNLVPLVFAAECVLVHASDEAFRRKKNRFPTRLGKTSQG